MVIFHSYVSLPEGIWDMSYMVNMLVGGAITILKNISQLGRIIPYILEIKDVPNHQPVWVISYPMVI